MRRYLGEPNPRPPVDPADELTALPEGTRVQIAPGDSPDALPWDSLPLHRPQRSALGPLLVNGRAWIEHPQASGGRRLIDAGITLPEQSMTAEPDRRVIARPMPTAPDGQAVLNG